MSFLLYDKTTDYAKNKYSEDIVYQGVDGTTVKVTKEQYLQENPDRTEADFLEIKAMSDANYHEQAKAESNWSKKQEKKKQIDSVPVTQVSLDEHLAEEEELVQMKKVAEELISSGKLSKIQHMRFILHFYEGKSYRQIAIIEGVSHVAIHKSVNAVIKKLKKFYKKG